MAVKANVGRRRIVLGQDRDESLEGVEDRLLSGHVHVLADEARGCSSGGSTDHSQANREGGSR
jgi:hypothetical protein